MERVSHVAGRTGFEPATGFTQHSLSRRAHSATLAPPRIWFEGSRLAGAQPVLNEPSNVCTFYHATLSGGSGIRTHVGVTQTCFQDMRLQPLGHPSTSPGMHLGRRRFYHNIELRRLIPGLFYVLLIVLCYTLVLLKEKT